MKIAYFTDTFFPSINGVVSASYLFAKGMKNLGHEVKLFAPHKRNELYEHDGVEVEGISSVSINKLYSDTRVVKPLFPYKYKKVKKFDPDIIHFHTPFILGTEAIVYANLLNKPLLGTFHTNFMDPDYSKVLKVERMSALWEKVLWKVNNVFFNRCDVVVTPSIAAKKKLSENNLKKQIKVVNNPIDLNLIKKVSDEKLSLLKKRYWLGENVLIYVGRISQEKSLITLILSFKKVLEKIDDAQLLLIGGGPQEMELRDLVIGLGIERSVVFVGKVKYEKLLSEGYFQLGKCFVTASASECQPMTIIEAMAFALPLILADSEGNPEMVDGNGKLTPVGDVDAMAKEMIQVLMDEDLRLKYSKKSFELVKKYSIEKVCLDMEKVYQELL